MFSFIRDKFSKRSASTDDTNPTTALDVPTEISTIGSNNNLAEIPELTEEANKIYEGVDPEQESLKYQNEEEANKTSKNVLLEFIKQLRPGIELYRVSVPAFILQPVSLLEKLSIYSYPTNVLQNVWNELENTATTPETRMVKLLAWILSTWRSIPRYGIQEVKPYNPILGEQFFCKWKSPTDDSESEFIAEQVGHHPPITAFIMRNKKHNFEYGGAVLPTLTFSINSFTSKMPGVMNVRLLNFGETYEIECPSVKAVGILYGTRMLQIADELVVTCPQTSIKAVLKFDSTKSGNTVEGTIFHMETKEEFYQISGVVSDKVLVTNLVTGAADIFYEAAKIDKFPIDITPVHLQEPHHSRRNWHFVTAALRDGRFDDAQLEKHKVEQRQRDKKIDEATWQRKLFKKDESRNSANAPAWNYIGDAQ